MDKGPWWVWKNEHGRADYIVSEDDRRAVSLKVGGDFADDAERLAYCEWLAGVLNSACVGSDRSEDEGRK